MENNIPKWIHSDCGKFRDAFGYCVETNLLYMNWKFALKLFGGIPVFWFSMIDLVSVYSNKEEYWWILTKNIEDLFPGIVPKKHRKLISKDKFIEITDRIEKMALKCIDGYKQNTL